MLNTMRQRNQQKRLKGLRQLLGTTTQIGFCSDSVGKRDDNVNVEVDSHWKKKRM